MIQIYTKYSTDRAKELLGFLPQFLDENDPRPAVEQLDANYQHGGGWKPGDQWTLNDRGELFWPGDPPYEPFAFAQLHGDTIFFYEYGIVCVVNPDGKFQAARMN